MGSICLVYGRSAKVDNNYAPRSLASFEPPSESPFWLDLLSPPEHLLHRISFLFRFHPRALKAYLSGYSSPSCEDFGDYLFIKTFVLEPSQKKLFIRADITIFLSSQYLITIHKSTVSLRHLLPGIRESGFNRTTALVLTLFDSSIGTLVKPLYGEDYRKNLLIKKDGQLNKSPLWWRLKNLKAALLHHEKLLHRLAFVGARFFNQEDNNSLSSILVKISLLSEQINTLSIG